MQRDHGLLQVLHSMCHGTTYRACGDAHANADVDTHDIMNHLGHTTITQTHRPNARNSWHSAEVVRCTHVPCIDFI